MLHEEARKALLKCVLRLYQKGLVQLNSGNVSVRISDEHLVITPTGISYDDMSEEDLVIIDLHGSCIEGEHKPSSETPMHMTVYKNIPDVKAIVHTHSPFAMAFAVVGRCIPIVSTEGLAVRGPIPVADYACPGTEAQGWAAIKAMKGPPYVMGTLLKNHGVLVTGANLSHAYSIACRIEMAAKVYFLALQIGEPGVLTDDQIKEIRNVYLRK
ncbi:MAG: class II aldolase/adducin family protein [Syntrophales bacterium]|jgi:L-ribulose-5-phosphate 4-epimerase